MENLTVRQQNDSNPAINSTAEGDLVNETIFQALGGLAIFIMLIGIPGNFLVICCIGLNKQMRTRANFLVLSLGVFDTLFLCTMLPVHTYTLLTGREPPTKFCWTVGFVSNCLVGSSVLITGSIAINRYIFIVLNSKYRQINASKFVIISCTIAFLLPLIIVLLAFRYSSWSFGFKINERSCTFKATTGTTKNQINVFVFMFPMIFMTLCYSRILLFVVKTRKTVAAHGQTPGTSNRNREARLTIMLAMVYVVYLLTTLPALVMNITVQMNVPVPPSALRTGYTVVYLSSATNPVMYGLVNNQYRNAYKKLWSMIQHSFSTET